MSFAGKEGRQAAFQTTILERSEPSTLTTERR